MQRQKAVIIGGSIAGLAAACLLGRHMDILVVEQKPCSQICNKICANIVTSKFLNLAGELGINPRKVVSRKFSRAEFYSETSSVNIPIGDYEINRKELISSLIKKAQDTGVRFIFNARFIDVRKSGDVLIGKNRRKITEHADFVIGADGALSNVAKKSGLWQNRKFWLAVKANVPAKAKISPNKYKIFFVKKFGYYSYIFPSNSGYVIGVVAQQDNAVKCFNAFAEHLGLRKPKFSAALIPQPKLIRTQKKSIFLLGDAACMVKFTGGGIVPAIESAFALRDILIYKNRKKAFELKKTIFFNHLVTKLLSKFKSKDFEILFRIAGKVKGDAAKNRDNLSRIAVSVVLKNPGLLRFLPKLFWF
ncbi:MAG: NAD(P)/FAD-dependent oxidoreductase [archaeon]